MTKNKVTFESSDEIVNDPEKLVASLNNPMIMGNTNIPIDTEIQAINQNPFTIEGSDKNYYPTPDIPKGLNQEKAGIFETGLEEFKEWSTNYKALDAGYGYLDRSALNHPPTNPNWTPTLEPSDYVDLPEHYRGYLLDSKNPEDLAYRKNRIADEMHHEEVLNNGSALGKLLGGFLGGFTPIGSLENMIPIAAMVKYGKVGMGALKTMMRTAPGLTAAMAIRNGATQMDKIDGNLTDFVKDTFVDSVAAISMFGGAGAIASGLEHFELGKLGGFAKAYLKDINFNFKVNEKGHILGFEALPANGSVSAAAVSKAQEMADSAFYKGGIFKIPYLGDATLKAMTFDWIPENAPIIGGLSHTLRYLAVSPLIQMVTSKYPALAAFADKTMDHFITTVGVAKGGTQGVSVEGRMKQERASIKKLFTLTDALHLERNGLSAPPRPLRGLWNAGLAFRQKTLEQVNKEVDKTDFISRDQFMDEVQNVLWSKEASEHDAVNTAAGLYRDKIDKTWAAYRKAYNLPDTWLPSRTAESYLMRVYDTAYMESATGERAWMEVIPQYLKQADELINGKMQPIRDLEETIKDFEEKHTAAVYELGTRDLERESAERGIVPVTKEVGAAIRQGKQVGMPAQPAQALLEGEKGLGYTPEALELSALRKRLKLMNENLQNELRSNKDLLIHVDDVNDLSSDEAKELSGLLKPLNDAKSEIKQQEKVIAQLKKQRSKQLTSTKQTKTEEKAKPKAEQFVETDVELQNEEAKIRELQDKVFNLHDELESKAQAGQMNPRFYKKIPNSERYEFKNPNERLKFRDTYESDFHRQAAAKGYYQSILNLAPEDIIADTMGKLTGNQSENALKSRSLMIPDSVLYKNNFMTRDLKAKTANYVNYLARRTHMKNAFQDITINGGFDEVAKSLLDDHLFRREAIQNRIDELNTSIKDETNPETIDAVKKDIKTARKDFDKEVRDFNNAKKLMKNAYETRVMGVKKRSQEESQFRTGYMSLVSATNLHNLPATQITDFAAIALQHGVMPFVLDGIYPIIQSIGGILKTKDSEAMRKMAPHLNLGMNDYIMGQSEKLWGQELNPTLNLGKIVSGLEKYSHFTANTDLTTFIDNGVQHVAGGVIQSKFMSIMQDYVKGEMSEKDGLYLRKYGIDPAKWAKRMVDAYEKDGGYKTAVGGYQSAFWQWEDVEAANLFGDGVFKGINNTLLTRGWGDSPFFADNSIGMIFHTFTGWGYASVNRYMIPALQHPDAEMMARTLFMLGAGSLVSPMRRVARGEDAYPDDMTMEQRAYEAIADSGVFSNMASGLNYVNMLTDDELMGDLKNDKFRNRMHTGLGTVGESTMLKMGQVLSMFASRDLNEKDLKTLAHMSAISGSMYGRYATDRLIETLGYPQTRAQAEALKE